VLGGAPDVWARKSSAITRKYHPVARWAGVRGTFSGRRNVRVCVSRPCQPRKRQRPKAAKRSPVPPRSATSERTLHTTIEPVGRFSTSGSGGQLLVYE
jgi:hypothetical protein